MARKITEVMRLLIDFYRRDDRCPPVEMRTSACRALRGSAARAPRNGVPADHEDELGCDGACNGARDRGVDHRDPLGREGAGDFTRVFRLGRRGIEQQSTLSEGGCRCHQGRASLRAPRGGEGSIVITRIGGRGDLLHGRHDVRVRMQLFETPQRSRR